MKILLIVPPYRTTDALVAALYPMPLAAVSLAAVLREAGHSVVIKDFLATGPAIMSASTPRPASFAGLGAPAYRHYGERLSRAMQWTYENARCYDAVGLCAGPCNVYETCEHIAQAVAARRVPLVVGGPFVTTATDEALARFEPHVAVVGEGEGVAIEAFEIAASGDKATLRGEPIELGSAPAPDWSTAHPSGYPLVGGHLRGVLAVSRGCPWQCRFCSVWTVMSRLHRRLPVEQIAERLLHLWQLGVRYFCFLDDNLFISERAADEVLGCIEHLRATVSGFRRARFYVEEGIEVRVAAVPGLIARIAAAGFRNIALGVETMRDARRRAVLKPYSEEELAAAVAECRAAGVTPRAFYIVGLPGDTVESVAADIAEFARCGMAVRPNNLKLYPGTAVTEEFRAAGLIPEAYDWRLSSFHTPDAPWLAFSQVRKLKTVLGAVGEAVARFGVNPLEASLEQLRAGLAQRGYRVEGGGVPLALEIRGSMYRPSSFRHLAMLVLLAWGAAGACAKTLPGEGVRAEALETPADEVQAAICRALRGEHGTRLPLFECAAAPACAVAVRMLGG